MEGPIEALVQIDDGSGWLHLTNPVRLITADRPDEVAESLRQVDAAARAQRRYAAGFVRYEAGEAFGLDVHHGSGEMPLVWFALFDSATLRVTPPERSAPYHLGEIKPSIDPRTFREGVDRIRASIADGETYQVNYTWRLRGAFTGDAVSFFADLCAAQRGRYGALLRTGRFTIASASPELFFSRDAGRIVARPMKGTTARGRFPAEDRRSAARLRRSAKERAENIMVVDMVRNDIGRIAAIGSVEVPELYTLEPYPNVWQMTSTITARTNASLDEIFAATFPSASVTGAPKHRTMQIIAALEQDPRGVYSGAVGVVGPEGAARFNVAIRTAVIDEASGDLAFGVGSGITWDSNRDEEYEECLLKASVLGRRPESFELLETIRWTPGEGWFLLERHLERLRESAEYFGFRCSPGAVSDALARVVAAADRALRVRLLLAEDGTLRVEQSPLEPSSGVICVGLADAPIDSSDVFLFHKTTRRARYDQARSSRFDDVILWNAERQVTESTIANIVVEIGGRRVTPPVECGLLAGTLRAELLASGEIVEAPIAIDQLAAAPRFWLINSVRGWCPALLAPAAPSSGARVRPS